MSKWDELTQLEVAYSALKTQPYEIQTRMLAWLESRCYCDHLEAKAARESTANKIAKKGVAK